MSLVDSAAAFKAHCNLIDGSGALKALLEGNNLTTFSQLAFAAGTPQAPLSDEAFKEFGTQLNGGLDLMLASLARLRRLHFEAQTLVVAHLKSQVAADSSDSIRKLPLARLAGMQIRGDLQPSYGLIDIIANMSETSTIAWVPPSKCTKRDAEVQMTLKEKPQKVTVEQQTLKLASPPPSLKADTTSELQFQWAMQRRGFAFDQCRLIEHDTHNTWLNLLLQQMTKEPPPVSVEQALRADTEVFTLMSQEIVGKLTADDRGRLPMNEKLKTLIYDPRITMHLLPLPKGQSRPIDTSTVEDPPVRRPAPNPKKKVRPAPSAKAKSKCPAELKDFEQFDSEGNPICWSYNLSGCKEEVKDGRCKKGHSYLHAVQEEQSWTYLAPAESRNADTMLGKRPRVARPTKVSRAHDPGSTVGTSRVVSGKGGAKQSADNLSSIQGSACVLQSSSKVVGSNNIDNGALSNSCEKWSQFQGKPLEKILVLEIFAGTGRLTAALRDRGFTSMAIDKDPSRSKQAHIVQYDLVDEAQRNSLLQLIDKEGPSILRAHFAPSCGTASRSRERPLKKFEAMGFSVPKPLRSHAFLLGLPNLQGLDS